jgi:glutathione S-transferase
MIRLQGFGPAFGLPDPSPFVIKAQILLKMSGLPFEVVRGDMRKAPKGKLPVIEDGGKIIPDSTLIRFYLEEKYAIDFDKGLSPAQKGAAWAFEKLCDDHLYWLVVQQRWMDDANFARGPAVFFKSIPALIRPLIVGMVRKKVKRNLFGQGTGRFDAREGRQIVARAFQSIADYLATQDFLGGANPCGSDASLFAALISASNTLFEGYVGEEARKHASIMAYIERMKTRYYPEGYAS